jgi:leucyl/phenylalanyl-tRNA--protein transferase
VAAYRQGIFPWFSEPKEILWWSTDPRAVIFPAELHLHRSLRKRLRQAPYRVTADTAFDAVISGLCRTTVRVTPAHGSVTGCALPDASCTASA